MKPLAPLERTVLALELRLLFYLLFRVGNHHPPLSAYHFVSFSSFFFLAGDCVQPLWLSKRDSRSPEVLRIKEGRRKLEEGAHHEYLQSFGGLASPPVHPCAPAQDPRNQVLRGYLVENTGALFACLCHQIFGSVLEFPLPVSTVLSFNSNLEFRNPKRKKTSNCPLSFFLSF